MEKICIVGGGASALMCACFTNKNVVIYEKQERYGKKILATGNGRCNLTNRNMNTFSYNTRVEDYLKQFNVAQLINFFGTIGLEVYSDEEGRVYPLSNTATSVLSVLKNYINLKKNIQINTEKCIKNIFLDKKAYKIEFEDGSFESFDKVVVASGNYTDLSIFKKFNIKYKRFLPSLCSLKTDKHKHLSGVRVDNVLVTCEKLKFHEVGEILFKDDGVSGIVVFNLSAYMARVASYKHNVNFDFLHSVSYEELKSKLLERVKNLSGYTIEEFLTGVFHKQLSYEILKRSGVNLNSPIDSLGGADIDNICKNVKNFEIETNGYFDNNQVASGGICLSELNEKLESKTNKGLYFIGEVCDVDGVCGGYNLQWAWTSGKIVGENL